MERGDIMGWVGTVLSMVFYIAPVIPITKLIKKKCNLEEVPGPLLKTTEEVIDAINNIDEITSHYSEKYDEFYNRFCHIEDGNASERIFDVVFR